ncbi:MAG: hypothetical protein P1Q69_02570 [Candidatus Thorarchaeota archaeon]|nr:hypothetical protein [Candidatus Thorarchaeota archaeon]
MPASIILDELETSYDWASTFELSVAIKLDSNPLVRINATIVYYFWSGYPGINGTLVYNSLWSEYQGTVDAQRIPAGSRILNIVAQRLNYTIPIESIPLDILELETELIANVDSISAIFGVDESSEVRLTFTSGSENLVGATITFLWDGLERTASWSNGEYVFQFNPSGDSTLAIPGVYTLTFTASLMNYTTSSETVRLDLAAETRIVADTLRVEEGLSFTLIFAYWDAINNRSVPGANVQYMIGTSAPITTTSEQFNGTHYLISLDTYAIGEISANPYQVRIIASAPGYQNWTESTTGSIVLIYIDNPTVDILTPFNFIGSFLGIDFGSFRIARDVLYLVLGMTGLFAVLAGSVVGIQRWRIPHAIKQINKAIKQMESGKVASVVGIKSMGVIISELLGPGLAELDIEAPMIDAISEGAVTGLDETADILGELDTLDEIGVAEQAASDDVSDFESELEAELDGIIEDAQVEPETEVALVDSDVEPASEMEEAEPEDIEVSEDEVAVIPPEEEPMELPTEESDDIESIEEEETSDIDTDETESLVEEESTDADVTEPEEEPEADIDVSESEDMEELSEDIETEIEGSADEPEPDVDDDVSSEVSEDVEVDTETFGSELSHEITDEYDSEELVEETSENEDVISLVTPEEIALVGDRLLEMGLSQDEVEEILMDAKDLTYSELLEVLDKIEANMK